MKNENGIDIKNGWGVACYSTQKNRDTLREKDIVCLEEHDHEKILSMSGYDSSVWLKTSMPSTVVNVLNQHGKIEKNLFFEKNIEKVSWVHENKWCFRKEFEVTDKKENEIIRLVFKGLDYKVDIWINGTKVKIHEDMFTSVEIILNKYLIFNATNILLLVFHPIIDTNGMHDVGSTMGHVEKRAHLHRCQMSWGWDWSRKLLSPGVWDDVEIKISSQVLAKNISYKTHKIEKDDYLVNIALELENYAEKQELILVYELFPKNFAGTPFTSEQEIVLRDKSSVIKHSFTLSNAKLWFPNGYGYPHLYNLKISIYNRDIKLCEISTNLGVKEQKMLRNQGDEKDSYPLTFSFNGVKVFARGANWVPLDLLFDTIDRRRYKHLIRQAKEAHFNMFRVWGGGLIEKDDFYDLCDEAGIMVWQEFPLACSSYPDDEKFLKQKSIEAEEVIKRLRVHPCLSLWCGGNELMCYGEKEDSAVLKVFNDFVEEFNPEVPYHLSSPDMSRYGERHHGPWNYQNHIFCNSHKRLFASEFGCNAMPSIESVKKFIGEEKLWPLNSSYEYHFALLNGVKSLNKMTEEFSPNSLEQFISATQIRQADMLQYMFERYQSNKWSSSGVLIWQYNEPWPTCSYSLIDYYGTPKMAYYWLKRSCDSIQVSVKDNGSMISPYLNFEFEIWVNNECQCSYKDLSVRYDIITKKGKIIKSDIINGIELNKEEARCVKEISLQEVDVANSIVLLNVELLNQGEVLCSNTKMYSEWGFKDIWEQDDIDLSVSRKNTSGKKELVLDFKNNSKHPAFGVEIDVSQFSGFSYLSDNYFFILPGKEKEVRVCFENNIKEYKDIRIKGWNFKTFNI